jgi:DNA-binding transcriptional MerR regulator
MEYPLQTFSTSQVARLTGATLRQLQWWDEKGIVSPALDERHARQYSYGQLIAAAVMAHCRKKEIPLRKVANAIKLCGIPIGKAQYLVTDGKKAMAFLTSADAIKFADSVGKCWFVDIQNIKNTICM